jgi:hypothetical protein
MTKEEWIGVLNSAYYDAQRNFFLSEHGSPEEFTARLCMNMFDYLKNAIKESDKR